VFPEINIEQSLRYIFIALFLVRAITSFLRCVLFEQPLSRMIRITYRLMVPQFFVFVFATKEFRKTEASIN
jgi:hypothetical protein